MDKFTKAKRSDIMSKVKGENTSLELIVFSYLRKHGVHFQRHYRKALGNPDVALPRKKKAVFIDGDFWHGWGYQKKKRNWPPYWKEKVARNIRRDKRNRATLRKKGWRVMRIWEHQLALKNRDMTLRELLDFISDA